MRAICFAGSAVRAEALHVLAPCQLSFAIQRIQVRSSSLAKSATCRGTLMGAPPPTTSKLQLPQKLTRVRSLRNEIGSFVRMAA